jgi:putative phage-type endonuclease
MPLLIATQGSPEWHAARIGLVTSSRAAGCLGLSPYMSAKKAWRIIRGLEVEEDNPYMQRGRALESHVISQYEIETGRIAKATGLWVSDKYPFLGATPDSLIDDDGTLEVKVLGKPIRIIPVYYRIQCIVQLICTGRKWCDFFAMMPDGSFFLRRVHLSGEAGLVRRLAAFIAITSSRRLSRPGRNRRGGKQHDDDQGASQGRLHAG